MDSISICQLPKAALLGTACVLHQYFITSQPSELARFNSVSLAPPYKLLGEEPADLRASVPRILQLSQAEEFWELKSTGWTPLVNKDILDDSPDGWKPPSGELSPLVLLQRPTEIFIQPLEFGTLARLNVLRVADFLFPGFVQIVVYFKDGGGDDDDDDDDDMGFAQPVALGRFRHIHTHSRICVHTLVLALHSSSKEAQHPSFSAMSQKKGKASLPQDNVLPLGKVLLSSFSSLQERSLGVLAWPRGLLIPATLFISQVRHRVVGEEYIGASYWWGGEATPMQRLGILVRSYACLLPPKSQPFPGALCSPSFKAAGLQSWLVKTCGLQLPEFPSQYSVAGWELKSTNLKVAKPPLWAFREKSLLQRGAPSPLACSGLDLEMPELDLYSCCLACFTLKSKFRGSPSNHRGPENGFAQSMEVRELNPKARSSFEDKGTCARAEVPPSQRRTSVSLRPLPPAQGPSEGPQVGERGLFGGLAPSSQPAQETFAGDPRSPVSYNWKLHAFQRRPLETQNNPPNGQPILRGRLLLSRPNTGRGFLSSWASFYSHQDQK
ncbi:hypothetical protein L345_02250, partial [Ophiophagus hannah]